MHFHQHSALYTATTKGNKNTSINFNILTSLQSFTKFLQSFYKVFTSLAHIYRINPLEFEVLASAVLVNSPNITSPGLRLFHVKSSLLNISLLSSYSSRIERFLFLLTTGLAVFFGISGCPYPRLVHASI